jgi:hypothetical protein
MVVFAGAAEIPLSDCFKDSFSGSFGLVQKLAQALL